MIYFLIAISWACMFFIGRIFGIRDGVEIEKQAWREFVHNMQKNKL
jgi:hypothetical protein